KPPVPRTHSPGKLSPFAVNCPLVPTVFVSTWQDAGEPCVRKAWESYKKDRDLLTACEQGLIEVELDPRFRAIGFGGMPNADDEACAAGATGVGEDNWRFMLSFRAVENMRNGMSAQQACDSAIGAMVRRKPETREKTSVVFAVFKSGEWGAAASKEGFTAWI